MNDPPAMTVIDGSNDLAEDVACLVVIQGTIGALLKVLVKVDALDILHNQEQGIGCFKRLVEADNVGVIQRFHQCNFAYEARQNTVIVNALVNNLS